jgi:hypothetical protein
MTYDEFIQQVEDTVANYPFLRIGQTVYSLADSLNLRAPVEAPFKRDPFWLVAFLKLVKKELDLDGTVGKTREAGGVEETADEAAREADGHRERTPQAGSPDYTERWEDA